MKTYIEHKDYINFEETWIPKSTSCDLYLRVLRELKNGEAELIPFVPPTPTWEEIRAKRDQLLKESDWASLPDATPKPNKEAWLNYRQALRDITKTFSSPDAVIWPTKPS